MHSIRIKFWFYIDFDFVFDLFVGFSAVGLSFLVSLVFIGSLSFLGFGVSPPTPDWGLMISDARGFMSFAPWGVIGPVIALSSLIIGINLTADALAKALGIDRAQKAPM